MDAWVPLEKQQYPHYFARRELRKREFIDRYLQAYGAPVNDGQYWHDHMAGLPPGYSVLIERGGLQAIEDVWGEVGRRHAEQKLAHNRHMALYMDGGIERRGPEGIEEPAPGDAPPAIEPDAQASEQLPRVESGHGHGHGHELEHKQEHMHALPPHTPHELPKHH